MSRLRRWLYPALLASSGTTLVFGGAVLFLLMLAVLFGPFSLVGPNPELPPRVGLWRPASLDAAALAASREAWRAAAPGGAVWSESDSLAELEALGVEAVVLPHARRLTAGERDQLARYVARGGGAVLAGAIGVRDARDEWLGWEAMRRLLGVSRVTPLPREQSFYVTAGPRGPLTAGLDPGQRIALAAEEGVPALADADAALHWSTYSLEPVGEASAAQRALERGAGRLVWLAVGPEHAADGAAVDALARLASAALAWAGRLPVAELATWPDAARFAALLAVDAEAAGGSAEALARLAERESLPLTPLDAAAGEPLGYRLGQPGLDRLTPVLATGEDGRGSLVRMARAAGDDAAPSGPGGVRGPEVLASEALSDARRVARLGGLYVFSLRGQRLAGPAREQALRLIGRGLRDEGAWLARGAELADWWRARAGLRLELERVGPRRLHVAVTHTGAEPIEGAVVRVHLQRPLASAALRATTALQGVREGLPGAAAPEARFQRGDASLDLALPPLAPGQRRGWHLDWTALSG